MFKQGMTLIDCLEILQKSSALPLAVVSDRLFSLSKHSNSKLIFLYVTNNRYYYKDNTDTVYCLCQKLPDINSKPDIKIYYTSESLKKIQLIQYNEHIEEKQYPV